MSKIVIYTTEDGRRRVDLRLDNQSVWLSLNQLATLFERDKSVVSRHIANVFEDRELDADSVVAKFATTAADGKTYQVDHYSLDMILAVGYRVRSPRGVQFRRWASTVLSDYLIKGFAIDDVRLKQPDFDYFDELLERIREIRASEKRFYQKVRDLFALSSDYQVRGQETHLFFAEVQNKLLFAVTGQTAAELVVARADPDKPNMALTAWHGGRVRKRDVIVAKNYLNDHEIDQLNRLVTIFLEQAEFQVKNRGQLTLDYWRRHVDRMLEFNEQAILNGAGAVSRDQMIDIAEQRYTTFAAQRKAAEIVQANADDLAELEQLAKTNNKR